MKLSKKFLLISISCVLLLSACSNKQEHTAPQSTQTAQTSQTQEQSQLSSSAETKPYTETSENQSDGTLYIGMNGNFKEYSFSGEKTPDRLIEAIGDLTGWNLSLADAVTDGKGGMTVCFSKDCSIFTGPPQEQKEDFFAYDNISLTQMILDSIQKTLQENYVNRESGGDPSNLDIYFCVMSEGNISDIMIPENNITVPMDQPYQGLMIQ